MAHHLRNGEHYGLVFCFVTAAGNLGSVHKGLHQYFLRFRKCLGYGRLYLLFRRHLGHAEAGTSQAGLNEARQTDFLHHIFIRHRLSAAQQQRFGNAHTETFQILVAGKLIVRERRCQYSATRIRDMEHIEIALQTAVLTRSSVDGDIGKVECHFLAIQHEAEVIAVYRSLSAVGQLYMPVQSVHFYNI